MFLVRFFFLNCLLPLEVSLAQYNHKPTEYITPRCLCCLYSSVWFQVLIYISFISAVLFFETQRASFSIEVLNKRNLRLSEERGLLFSVRSNTVNVHYDTVTKKLQFFEILRILDTWTHTLSPKTLPRRSLPTYFKAIFSIVFGL